MSCVRVSWCLPCLVLPLAACPSDGGETVDATIPDADTVSDVADTTAPDGLPDTKPETSVDAPAETDTGPVACQSFDFTGSLVANEVEGIFTLGGDVDLGLGGPLPDAMIFEFYSDETGTFDLAANGNDDYQTCKQCVRFVQDIDATGATHAKNFFQKAGTLTIDDATPPNGSKLSVTVANLEMVEVTIRASDFLMTVVDNGACYERAEPFSLETGECVPECGTHTCGPDGCGGVCGEACPAGEACRLDGSACESTRACIPLAIGGTLENLEPGVFRVDVTGHGFGAVGQKDFLQIEFYKDATGTFDLHGTSNRNYATCDQCVRLVVDGKTDFFQRQGQLVVNDVSVPLGDPETDGFVDLRLNGIVLEEVVIDEQFNSMAVEDGACVELVDGALSSPIP